ncbi:YcxB family protein [Neobacillus sp. 19]|uniref:YcxB family protein n=1 Tax=Neobacillus sp. 19 TaxID=3394458 RepID=UPI003C2BD88D
MKINIPIFSGITMLLLGMFIHIFVVYRKHLKKNYLFQVDSRIVINNTQLVIESRNSKDRQAFPLESLIRIKENKKWYFLYFQDKTFIPIAKKTEQSFEQIKECFTVFKPIQQILSKWTILFYSLSTIVGVYYVGSNAVNFNGALAWKISELKTETRIQLENDNFYSTKLDGILDSVKAKMELEPYLMTNDLKIEFAQDGTITDIYTYIYGFDQNQKLQSGYLIYFDKSKGNKLKVHKQDWNGQGTTVYDPNNDLSIVIDMLNWIPVEDQVKQWKEEKNAVLYKGIRNWGIIQEGIHFIDENGKTIPSIADPENYGPTISLYIPGKEEIITPQRYIYKAFFREEEFPL